MSEDIDLLQRLDEDLDHGLGPAPDSHVHLATGRRALRRRRAAAGLLAGAAVVAVLGAGAAWLPSPSPTDPQVASSPGPAAPATPDTPAVDEAPAYDPPAANVSLDGELELTPGWSVVQRIDDPMTGWDGPLSDGGPVDRSWAFALTKGDRTQFVLLMFWKNDGTFEDHADDPGTTDLAGWVDAHRALRTGGATPSLVQVEGSALVPADPAVTVLEQQPAPALGEGSHVAKLRYAGQPWWVWVDAEGAHPLFFPFVDDEPTLDGFVAHVLESR